MKTLLRPLLFITLLLIHSCGSVSNEERVENAILLANQLLTNKDCTGAKQVLDDLGYQTLNADYLIAYASTLACSTNYSTVTFFSTDITKIGSSNTAILGSLATFSTAPTTSSTDANYTNLLSAVNTLLYAGGVSSPSHTARSSKFNSEDLQEIEVFTMYLLLNLMGKYFYLHGNVDANGTKGAGTGANTCLTDYATANGLTAWDVADPHGNCTVSNDGHSELANGAANRKTYMCQGVVMFNNLLDIVSNITISGSNTTTISSLGTVLDTLCNDNSGAIQNAAVCTVKSQTECENIWDTDATAGESIEEFFAYVLEPMHV